MTVNYSTADETAIAGLDYGAASGKLTFARGQTSKTILVPVIGDRLGEQDETFAVRLSGAKNARIDDGTGVVTIRDDELHVSIGDAGIVEGNSGTTLMTFTVSLSAAPHEAVTVDYATQDGDYYGSAYAGEDYRAASGRLTFAPGETTKTITIEVFGDTEPEPTESFSSSSATRAPTSGSSTATASGRSWPTTTDGFPRAHLGGRWWLELLNPRAFTFLDARGRRGPCLQASLQPARHRLGTGLRRGRCPDTRSQTTRRDLMKYRSSAASLALAVVAVLGFAGPAAAQRPVPFHGYLEGDVTRTPTPPVVMVDIEATGVATRLGRFTLDVPHVVNPATSEAVGLYKFKAANGDRLTAQFTGQGTFIAGTDFLFIEETATITGGTGRFAGATGSFVVHRLFDTVEGTTFGFFDGTISRR